MGPHNSGFLSGDKEPVAVRERSQDWRGTKVVVGSDILWAVLGWIVRAASRKPDIVPSVLRGPQNFSRIHVDGHYAVCGFLRLITFRVGIAGANIEGVVRRIEGR